MILEDIYKYFQSISSNHSKIERLEAEPTQTQRKKGDMYSIAVNHYEISHAWFPHHFFFFFKWMSYYNICYCLLIQSGLYYVGSQTR